MNMTTSAGAEAKSAKRTVWPEVLGSAKSGAGVPSASMVEGVKAMAEECVSQVPLSSR
jgi:hypothetical protein